MTQPLFLNHCKWQSTSAGTGTFNVGAAAATDDAGPHDIPANCSAFNGSTYRYYAQSPDGTQTELGRGVYSAGTLTRVEVLANSLSTLVAVNFLVAPIVDMFPNPQQLLDVGSTAIFPSGTRMLFQQATAPTGWTNDNTANDWAVRIASGSGSISGGGGVMGMSTGFTYRTSDGAGLSVAQLAAHVHGDNSAEYSPGTPEFPGWTSGSDASLLQYGTTSGSAGSGAVHAHTYDMRIAYADFTLAQKN